MGGLPVFQTRPVTKAPATQLHVIVALCAGIFVLASLGRASMAQEEYRYWVVVPDERDAGLLPPDCVITDQMDDIYEICANESLHAFLNAHAQEFPVFIQVRPGQTLEGARLESKRVPELIRPAVAQEYDSTIASMVSSVSQANLQNWISDISPPAGHNSRVTFTSGFEAATTYIHDAFASISPSLQVEYDAFTLGAQATPPYDVYELKNVVATLPGTSNPEKIIIVCGHLDSCGNRDSAYNWSTDWYTMPAPGADDNATGIAIMLETARILASAPPEYTQRCTVKFVAFTKEESNPMVVSGSHHGSVHYANAAAVRGDDIAAVLNVDMVGFTGTSYDYDEIITNSSSEWIADTLLNMNILYGVGLDLAKVVNPSANWSDHSSFWYAGYDAVCSIENDAPWNSQNPYYVANPYYHKSSDQPSTVDMELVSKVARVIIAATAELSTRGSYLPTPYTVTGSILDAETGEGIAEAALFVSDLDQIIYANENGSYQLIDLPPGEHTIEVHAAGYIPQSKNVGQAGTLDFVLERAVPVLLYHNIIPNQRSIYRIAPDNLREHLDFLTRHGFQAITLDDLIGFVQGTSTPPKKSFVLTFDDNEKGILENGYPIVADHNFQAVTFVQTGSVGDAAHCTWSDLQALEDSRLFLVESHSITHPDLTSLSEARIREELTLSKQAIETHLRNKTVRFFAYPYGADNALVRSLTAELGYVAGIDAGSYGLNPRGQDPFQINRATVLDIYTLEDFKQKIEFWGKRHPLDPYIVDNDDQACSYGTGQWTRHAWISGSYADSSYGTSYLTVAAVSGDYPVSWSTDIEQGGEYAAYAWWAEDTDNASSVTYSVTYAGGTTSVVVDQRAGGGGWNLLGYYYMNPGATTILLRSDAEPAGNTIVADAIKLQPLAPLNPLIWHTFENDLEGWMPSDPIVDFTPPIFSSTPGALRITSTTNTNCFGFWQSPADVVAALPDSLYRARFTVRGSLGDQSRIPSLRLRLTAEGFQQTDYLLIQSAGDGSLSPGLEAEQYELYCSPWAPDVDHNGAGAHLLACFDLLNFDPEDSSTAALELADVRVDRIPLTLFGTTTLIKEYTFETTSEGWAAGGAPLFFDLPQPGLAEGCLTLTATNNTNTFGFWTSPAGDFVLDAPSSLYRFTFVARTDALTSTTVPQCRFRINDSAGQWAVVRDVFSTGEDSRAPWLSNRSYALYYVTPPDPVVQTPCLAIDLLNFDPSDDPAATLFLDTVIVEKVELPEIQ
jgi:peptidoglycan/xylan/chitin deacetylase (PgdA/CDA1 family)